MDRSRPVAIFASGKTDIGLVRSVNQDSVLVDLKNKIFMVADGMGGHAGGEVASRLCIDACLEFLASPAQQAWSGISRDDSTHLAHKLGGAINYASSVIYEKALEDPNLKGMGTTATMLKIIENMAFFAHVGDSRLFLYRAGLMYQLSYDHSLVEEQIRAGILTPEEASHHHLRNVITRSVGYQEEEDVDTGFLDLLVDDWLILSSDGLHGKVTTQEIGRIIKEFGLLSVDSLVQLARERGGEDNISVIVVQVKG